MVDNAEQQHRELKVKLTSGDLTNSFIRSNVLQASWNYERMQAVGFCFQMIPAIKRLYPAGAERNAALKRHLEFFNTHPYMTSPILGVVLSMEEQRANGAPIDDAAINGVKVGMMGPLAGVGDPVFWGTLRPVLASFGAGLASSGSILGPIVFFLVWNILRLAFRYYSMMFGYKQGTGIVEDMSGGILQKLTEGASILGLFVMGVLVPRWTTMNFPLKLGKKAVAVYETGSKPSFDSSGNVIGHIVYNTDGTAKTHLVDQTLQEILNTLLPGLAPLLLTFLCMWLLKKKVNAIYIIFGLFIVGILGYWIGLFGIA